ncbi:hypothetical protein SAMN04488587_2004 [Methanococcoides vulcani]|uniref:Uncharacterized protein n=1 Tax=Methanococcoides vulcani TaxID=1353158 RepID=A0A1I0B696_9EURY|nr:hypothetical protein SAMN04488587_2004 [Methanococcoides vulcani]
MRLFKYSFRILDYDFTEFAKKERNKTQRAMIDAVKNVNI